MTGDFRYKDMDYVELKLEILTAYEDCKTPHDFHRIKQKYTNEINSPRRLFHMSTLHELFTILEKRDCDNMKLLYDIAYELGRPDITTKYFVKKEYMAKTTSRVDDNNVCHNGEHVSKKNTIRVLQKVYNIIASDIGKKWKDMARGLNVRENEIDEITIRYNNDIKSQVFAIFRLFEEREDERDLKYMLCNALDRARRKDLRQKIEKIMLQSS